MNNRSKLLIGLLLFSWVLFAQSKYVSGKVVDMKSNSPIAGATVQISNTSIGTVTNTEGDFSFAVNPRYSNENIVISYVGMITKEIPISEFKRFETIYLNPEKSNRKSAESYANIVDNKNESYPKTKSGKSTYTEGDFPVERFNDSFNFEILKEFLEHKKGFNISWHKMSFTNTKYASSEDNGTLKNTFGFDLYKRNFFWTSMFADFDCSFSFFSKDGAYFCTNSALKASLSTILFPAPKFLLPSAGVGYQLSALQTPAPEGSTNMFEASSNTSCFFWKVGLQSFLSDNFSINCEYSQSLFTTKTNNLFSIGLGIYLP